MPYDSNLAYDFDLFTERKKKDNIIDLPSKKEKLPKILDAPVKRAEAAQSAGVALKTKVTAAFIILLVLGFVFLRVQGEVKRSELGAEITRTKAEIEVLKSEKTRLDMELENAETYNNIEEKAREMGMHKREAAQTTYIDLDENDEACVIGDSSGKTE